MLNTQTPPRRRLRIAAAATLFGTTLAVAGCASPGGADENAQAASKDRCADSAAVKLINETKAMPSAERETRLLADAVKTNDGTINLYAEINDPSIITDPFEEKYPDLTVNVYRAGSEQIRQRILEESSANFKGADLAELDSLEMAILDKQKLLAPASSPLLDQVSEAARFDNFIGDRLSYIVPVWNTKKLAAKDAPTSLEDLADPRFKGKLALEGSDVFWFAGLVEHMVSEGQTKEQAVDLFKKIAANSAITSGHTTTTELVVAGQYAIAANNYIHRALELQGKGAPLAFTPVKVPVVVEITALAVPCLSANPPGALLLQDFMLSADGGQKAFIEDGRSPSNSALAQDTFGGQAITPIKVDVAGISANYEEWATLWDEVIRNGSKK